MLARIHIMEAFRRCGEDLSLTKQMGHLWGLSSEELILFMSLWLLCAEQTSDSRELKQEK